MTTGVLLVGICRLVPVDDGGRMERAGCGVSRVRRPSRKRWCRHRQNRHPGFLDERPRDLPVALEEAKELLAAEPSSSPATRGLSSRPRRQPVNDRGVGGQLARPEKVGFECWRHQEPYDWGQQCGRSLEGDVDLDADAGLRLALFVKEHRESRIRHRASAPLGPHGIGFVTSDLHLEGGPQLRGFAPASPDTH